MAKNKTTETTDSVEAYVNAIADEKRKADISELVKLFEKQTGLPPKMWGSAIIGYGSYHYKYASGHEGDAPLVGLSSRANAIVLYLGCDSPEREALLQQVGKYKAGKGCVYIRKLEDVETTQLENLVKYCFMHTKETYK